jgi:hypothetical protein
VSARIEAELFRDVLQQLKDGKHDVIHITKSTCFSAFGVMEATGPIDGDVGCPSTQLAGGREGRSGIHTTEIKHVGEDWTVLNTVEVVNQMLHIILVARSDPGSIVPCEEHREP